ncbi:MAG: DolP-mannose mannosyltransferase [Thermoanaerobaculia bacterium]
MAREVALVGGLFFVVTLAIACLLGVTDLALDGDNEHYFFMAERAASGFSPYHSHFDSKQGLSMLLTGLVIALGRPLGLGDLAMARVLSLVVLGLSLWLTWWLTLSLTGSRRAGSFAGLAMIGFSGYLYQAVMGSRPKVFLVLFMLLTMLLFVQRWHFWAGVSAALAFLCWQPALLMLGVMLLVLLVCSDRLESITRVLAGALLTVVAYQLFFFLHGSMGEQLRQTYYFPAKYMRHEFSWAAGPLNKLPQLWFEGFGRFNLLPLLAGLGLIGSGIGWLRRVKQGGRLAGGPSRGWLYVSLCFVAWILFTVYDHQGYMDLFVLLPFLAIIVGATLDRWVTRPGRPIWEQVGVGVVLLGFGLLIYQGAQMHRTDFGLREQRVLATRVDRMLEEGEKIYAIECTHLLAFNKAENWSKFGFFFRGVGRYLRAEKKGRGVLRLNRQGERPSVVLVSHHVPREIRRELRRSYREVFDREFEQQGIRVFHLSSREDG